MRNPQTTQQNFSLRPNSALGKINLNNGRSFDQLSNQSFNGKDGNTWRNESFNDQNRNWGTNGNFSIPHLLQEATCHKTNHTYNHGKIDLTILLFAESATKWHVASFFEQKFPLDNNQISSNGVRFTTIDDSINELSDLCPLNCQSRPTWSPQNL